MRIKIAPDDPQSMSQDGDAILRSLQNKSLPMVDLMIRESLQNSLDASMEASEKVVVDFFVNTFKSENLAGHLEGITEVLKEKYNGEQKYIAIRDTNTTGLNGEYLSKDIEVLNNSNFHKLVFGIGKNQSKEGAGGSWGLGKTSYFRMGIGLVIYYTRIKTNNGFEERLVASLIESPKKEARILPWSDRGIAWWGTYKNNEEDIITPIIDKEEISSILNIFRLKHYEGNQTGTTIIIPYVSDLYQGEEYDTKMPWEYKDKNIIDIAVQRWYIPRLLNDTYKENINKSILECNVNNEPIISKITTQPIFEVFQDLYNAALTKDIKNDMITVKDIYLGSNAMKDQKKAVGTVAFKEVNKDELMMGPPHNKKSAMEFLGHRDGGVNERHNYKIMAYSRSPGMIVEYDIDGEWFPKESVQKEDHLLCAFFVPNSTGELSKHFEERGLKNLEAYLRSTENADHANWTDEDGFTLIKRVKSYTSRAIMQEYQTGEDKADNSATSALSRKFGGMLMPPTGFGKVPTSKTKKGKEAVDKSTRSQKSDLSVINSSIQSDSEVLINIRLNLRNIQQYRIFLQLITQEQKIDYADWNKTMGNDVDFPFVIKDTSIKEVNEVDKQENELLIIEKSSDEIIIENSISKNLVVKLELLIQTTSESYIPGLAIRAI